MTLTLPPELEPFPEMKLDAYQVYADAKVKYDPSHVFALFSGGNDSKVLVEWAKRTIGGCLDAAVFIDTGIACPGVREFAEDFCSDRGVPLKVYETPYSEFVAMCREHGMPGPGVHRWTYIRLKGDRVDQLVADHKTHHYDRIMLLAGARRAESQRRMGTALPVKRRYAQVWVNPLIDWSHRDMREFRNLHKLPESDVAALLHRSGECNCLAFPSEGERAMLMRLWPSWFEDTFGWLERELKAAGHRYWMLGMPRPDADRDSGGELCDDCNKRQMVLEAA